jgi:subtilisin family serine protease
MQERGNGSGRLPGPWGKYWRDVALAEAGGRSFLLRPAQLLAAPEDADEVDKWLENWSRDDRRDDAETPVRYWLDPSANQDPVDSVLEASKRLRAQGLRVGPNHVFAGSAGSMTFTGAPRVQGGPGSRVKPAEGPHDAPKLGAGDGYGVHVAVLDTGIRTDNEWLASYVSIAEGDPDWEELDVEGDHILDTEAGHGTFITGLILQVAPGARVSAMKVLNSHGIADDLEVAAGIDRLPKDVDILNLSLGGYTERDHPPLALSAKIDRLRRRGTVIVAAAGNEGADRLFWPAALKGVVAVGAVERSGAAADFSNHGWWVDACAPGIDIRSAFVRFTTEVAPAGTEAPVTFKEWARWSGTSFAAPMVAAALAVVKSSQGGSTVEALGALLERYGTAAPSRFPLARSIDFERLGADKQVPLPDELVG